MKDRASTALTSRNSVQHLCKSILNRLDNSKVIRFPSEKRAELQEEMVGLISPYIFTDEDLRSKTLEMLGASSDMLMDAGFTESSNYRTARSMVRKSFGDDELNGFYFQKSLREIAKMMAEFFMSSPLVDDVFESDNEVILRVVEVVKRFNPEQSH